MTHISRVTFLAGIDNLPETASPESLDDDDFLAAFHHALLEVTTHHVPLVCSNDCTRKSAHRYATVQSTE